MLYDPNLLLEEGNKCFEMDKCFGFIHEQHCALQDDWNEEAMYQRLCHEVVTQDEPVEGKTKGGLQAMNAPFEKKLVFFFKVSLKKLSQVIVYLEPLGR